MKLNRHDLRRYVNGIARRRLSQPPKVFGIGLPKTGTTTLSSCLSSLGYKHATFDAPLTIQVKRGNVGAAIAKAYRYDAFEDWPWFLIYRELADEFADAKFILTIRQDPESYSASLRRYRERKGVYSDSFVEPWWWREAIGYEPSYWDAEKFEQGYVQHNQEVLEFFNARPGRLVVLCWERGDQWQQLCRFIGEPMPDIPFPHLNRTTGTASDKAVEA